MKPVKFVLVVVAAAVTLGMAGSARAQGWNWNSFSSQSQFRDFEIFMRDHPWIAKKLWEKPQRVNDMGFLNSNRELKQWLEDHPPAARAFHEDPIGFMERERHFEAYGDDFFHSGSSRRTSLARFDWFLDGHPDIRHDLIHKPRLADDRHYLDRHPELADFLYHHPEVRAEIEDNPREFMDREAHYEYSERY